VSYSRLVAPLLHSCRLVLYYYLGDHVLYLAYKLARRDLYHWVPLEGAAMIVESITLRIAIKAITDFTGVVQFRGAGEMGGAAWIFSQGTALVASLVATQMYVSSDEAAADGEAIGNSFVWTIVGGLSASFILSLASFLVLMKRGFRGSFFSVQTGHAWVKDKFIKGNTDEQRIWLLTANKKQWASIRDDVKAWTLENWERWEEETPAWFNDNFKAAVDDDMIPPASLRELKGGGGARRRSSLGDMLGGGARVAPTAGGS
jgi:hypothetical protein